MKYFLILLLSFQLYGQSWELPLLFGDEATGVSYNANALTYFAKATTLVDTQKVNISDLFNMLDDSLNSGARNKTLKELGFDRLWIFANQDEASAKWDLTAQDTISVVSAMPFTAWQGYKGDGSADYLNSNFNASTDATNYTQNSASVFIYRRVIGSTATKTWMGVFNGSNQGVTFLMTSATSLFYAMNGGSYAFNDAVNNVTGLFAQNRTTNVATQYYINGVSSSSQAGATSLALLNGDFFVGADNLVGTGARRFATDEISIVAFGKSFDTTEHRKIKNCFQQYMLSIGKDVTP